MLRDRSTTGTLNERMYSLHDANWNVTSIVNTSGAAQERYRYTPYGDCTVLDASFNPRSGNVSLYDWETRYASYRWDSESGLYQVRYRYYHPLLGCWLTRDPIGYANSPNLVEYGTSSPIRGTDPRGLVYAGVGTGFGASGYAGYLIWGFGISITYTTGGFVHGSGFNPFNYRACVCDTASFTVLYPGIGVGALAGPTAFGTIGSQLSEGGSIGVGIGATISITEFSGELNVDIDPNGAVTVSGGKFPSLGEALFVAVRISGSCTGCSSYLWQHIERFNKVQACVLNVLSKISNAVQKLFPRGNPPNERPVNHHGSEQSGDGRQYLRQGP